MEVSFLYSKIASKITDFYIKKGLIKPEKSVLYSYGFQTMISTAVYLLICFIVAFLFNSVIETIFFLIGFLLVRRICGGYHAPSYISCHVLFEFVHIIFLIVHKYTPNGYYKISFILLNLISILIILFFAPVDHANKRFTPGEQKYFRKKSIYFAILLCLITIVRLLFHNYIINCFFYSSIGTFTATVSLLYAKIINTKEKNHESKIHKTH